MDNSRKDGPSPSPRETTSPGAPTAALSDPANPTIAADLRHQGLPSQWQTSEATIISGAPPRIDADATVIQGAAPRMAPSSDATVVAGATIHRSPLPAGANGPGAPSLEKG